MQIFCNMHENEQKYLNNEREEWKRVIKKEDIFYAGADYIYAESRFSFFLFFYYKFDVGGYFEILARQIGDKKSW